MTIDQATELVRFIGAAFPTQRARMQAEDVRGMLAAYTTGLVDLEFDRVKAAVTNLIRGSKWIPTIAEIREAVVDAEHGKRRAGGEAWGDVMGAIRRFGWSRSPGADFNFDDPIVADVVRALGWHDLCRSENSIADRARFVEAYDVAVRRERTEIAIEAGAVAKRLPGAPSSQAGNRPQISATRGGAAEEAPRALPPPPAVTLTPRGMTPVYELGATQPTRFVCDGDHGDPECYHPHCWLRPSGETP